MALSQGQTTSFKVELLKAVHDFSASGGDVFKIALYNSSAALDATTTVYTTTNEITGTNYTAGGNTLVNIEPAASGTTAVADFQDTSWVNATFTARGALIYNSSKGNKAVAVLDFGADKIAVAQTLTVQFPSPIGTAAIVSIA